MDFPRKGYEDSHLSLDQKANFWVHRFTNRGEMFDKDVLDLAEDPKFANWIHYRYTRYCRKMLLVTLESQNGVSSGKAAVQAAPADSTFNTGSVQNPIDLTCESDANPCVCGAKLTLTDDGLCQDCWIYFTVHAKACSIRNELEAQRIRSIEEWDEIERLTRPPDFGAV